MTPATALSTPAKRHGGARSGAGLRKRWTAPAGAQRRLFSLAEAAAYLGVSPWSVRDLDWKGRLPRVKISRRLLFDREDLDALIDREKDVLPAP